MTQVSLGVAAADWNTKARIGFPPVEVRKGRAVMFFLEQPGVGVDTANQYLAVIAILLSSYGRYELPLECKYFPGQDGIMFAVPVPDIDYDRDVDVEINLLPKEFKAGTATVKSLNVELSYDDDLLNNESVSIN